MMRSLAEVVVFSFGRLLGDVPPWTCTHSLLLGALPRFWIEKSVD